MTDPVADKATELRLVLDAGSMVRSLPSDSEGVATARTALDRAARQLSVELDELLLMPKDRR